MNPAKQFHIKVNGKKVTVSGGNKRLLMDVLRDDLRLIGSKNGCTQGYCGSCRVILNGEAVNSCTTTMRIADGAEVVTIEGIGSPENPHPLQRSFAEHGACQCGFCIPGFIVSAYGLLEKESKPAEADVREALRENVCRCTGYRQILEAIDSVVHPEKGSPVESGLDGNGVIGRSFMRDDALDKSCGTALYADDLYMDGMLYAAVLRSARPHARILSIDASDAEAMNGVHAVITAEDVPHNRFGLLTPDQPVFAEGKVRCVGEAVAAVAAESAESAQAALKKIRVEWEILEPLLDPREALKDDAPYVQDLVPEGQVIKAYGKNIVSRRRVNRGDVDAAFAECDVVIEREFTTPFVEHGYLEPEACLTHLEDGPDGGGGGRILVVECAGQNVFSDQSQVCAALRWEAGRVRVVMPKCGGAFGGKEDILPQIVCALLTVKTGRPVKYVLDREESLLASTKRHPFISRVKAGATRDGRIVAVDALHISDTGAYASVGDVVITRAATHAAGPYEVDNVRVDVIGVYTNNPVGGAMRGFGTPQAAYPIEVVLDQVAEALGMDPIELRMRNALEAGKRTGAGQLLPHSVGLKECVRKVAETVRWEKLRNENPNGSPWRRGVGIGLAYKNVGLGNASDEDESRARVSLEEDGRVRVRAGAAEIGQGMTTILRQFAAETIGVGYEDVDILTGDTFETPDSGVSSASRQTFVTGNAVIRAARDVKEQIVRAAAEFLDVPPEILRVEGGKVFAETTPERCLSLAEIKTRAGDRPFDAESLYAPPETDAWGSFDKEDYKTHVTYGYGAQAAVVSVNEETGEVRVERMVTAHDVGRVIHPAACRGQIEGGVVQGIGYALSEEYAVKAGRPKSKLFKKCGMPGIDRIPEIVTIMVEDPEIEGPFGAKGVGEVSTIPTAPAIINAIHDACGVWIYDLPATKEKVKKVLQAVAEPVSP
ncbi:MAG: molybdopterin-dependent oxidoreductase [Nitrospinota bacterium]|jgi:xanthine dehydrogenase molybdenum-binding subunit|nr:molybdopterin-dependent oxidoreductase [Nitrospinota bacterium]